MRRTLAVIRTQWIAMILMLCAVAMTVLWMRSYEAQRQPRLIVQVPTGEETDHLPRQSVIYYRSDHSCIYASVLHGWIRVGSIDIQEPFRVPPKNDAEGWMWIGNARIPDPKMAGRLSFVSEWFHGLVITASTSSAYGRIHGAAIPCWLLVIAFLTFPVITAFKMIGAIRRFRSKGLCKKCGYSLTGLTEPRCPECGTAFAPVISESAAKPP